MAEGIPRGPWKIPEEEHPQPFGPTSRTRDIPGMSYGQHEAEAFGGADHWSAFHCQRRLCEHDGLVLQVGDDSFCGLEGDRSKRTGGDKFHRELSWAAVPELCPLAKAMTENE